MKAQVLYDVREITGFVSGSDLHKIFWDVCENPSPSGYSEIDENKLPQYVRNSLTIKVTKNLLVGYYKDCVSGIENKPEDELSFYATLSRFIGYDLDKVADQIREYGERRLYR